MKPEKLADWALAVETYGLEEVRKVPGYHDEPLKGKRAGQRSIRLSRAYRAIYIIVQGSTSSCLSKKCTSTSTRSGHHGSEEEDREAGHRQESE